MNRAAVPGTLDDFVHEFLDRGRTAATAAALHRFFIDRVSGTRLVPGVARRPAAIRHRRDQRVVALAAGEPAAAGRLRHRSRSARAHRRAPAALGCARARRGACRTALGQAVRPADAHHRPARELGRIRLAQSSVGRIRGAAAALRVAPRRRRSGIGSIGSPRHALRASPRSDFRLRSGPRSRCSPRSLSLPIPTRGRRRSWTATRGTPLSERDPITAFDGTRNYLHWLAAAAACRPEGRALHRRRRRERRAAHGVALRAPAARVARRARTGCAWARARQGFQRTST